MQCKCIKGSDKTGRKMYSVMCLLTTKKYTPEVAKKNPNKPKKYTTEVLIGKQPDEIILTRLNR